MESAIITAQNILETLTKMPSILLIALALNVIGWGLKRISAFPNRLIPITIILASAFVMPVLLASTPTTEMSPYLAYPDMADLVRRVSLGLIVGFAAWAIHKTLISRLEKYLPGVASDTSFIEKPPPKQ